MGLLAVLRLGLALLDAAWLTFSLLIFFRIMILLLIVGFWGLANRLFTLEQGKRLFPIISAGDVISVMIGSFLVPVIINLIGTENLLLVVLLSIVICLISVMIIRQNYHTRLSESENVARPEPAPQREKADRTNPLRSRYILLIFGLYLLAWTINYVLDFAFLGQLQDRYDGDAGQIASFIGVLFGLIQLTNFFLKFFLAGRLISRYGLRFGLLVSPFIITASVFVSLAADMLVGVAALFFWLISFSKYGEEVLREAFNESSTRILYQPLPARQRTAVLGLVEGNGFSLTALIAGSLLVVFTLTGTYTPLRVTLLLAVLGVAWLVVALLTYRAYAGTLRTALKRRTFSTDQPLAGDAAALDLLEARLASKRLDEVVYALALINELVPGETSRHFEAVLTHPSADVQRYALEQIEATGARIDPAVVHAMAHDDPDLPVRAAALRVYCALAPENMLEDLQSFLTAGSSELQRAALIGLLRYGGIDGVLAAGERLNRMLHAEQPEQRASGSAVLGQVGIRSYYQPLLDLLHDNDLSVRRAALNAAGQVGHPRLWVGVIAALENRALRTTAADALASGGEGALDAIADSFNACPPHSATVCLQLARVCSRIPSARTVEILRSRLDWPQREVRTQILHALSVNDYHSDDADHIHERLRAEATDAARALAICVAVGDRSAAALLVDALHDELAQIRERMFFLLAFVSDAQAVMRARNSHIFGSETEQAYALEMIDILAPRHIKTLMLPLMESNVGDADRLTRLQNALSLPETSLSAYLRELIADTGQVAWIRAVALHTARILPGMDAPNPDPDDPTWEETVTMLAMIEKVLILKTVNLFANIPDRVLAELAGVVEEIDYPDGTTIFEKGDLGSSMYIIVSGKVRAHDGDVVFNYLADREVFGEFAVLDTEPRSASITTEEPTRVFRLDQADFYTVMADYPQVSQRIIQMLLGLLRARVRDVSALSARVQELEQGHSTSRQDTTQ